MMLPLMTEEMLRTKSEPVTSVREALEIVAELDRAYLTVTSCVGLAAIQIGIPKAVSIIRHPTENISFDLINPEFISGEEEFVHEREGCMSFPGRQWNVPRFKSVCFKNDGIWPAEEDILSPEDLKRIGRLSLQNLPDGARFIRKDMAFHVSQPISAYGGIIAVAVQHEFEHMEGICLPWKNGDIEIEFESEGVRRQGGKIGRNDPCPCGAMKDGNPLKYKKCCGR